jgi:hypothetical protein
MQDNFILTLKKLYLQGRHHQALKFASVNWNSLSNTEEAFSLVKQIRVELHLSNISSQIEGFKGDISRLAATNHQSLVRELLRDTRYLDTKRLEQYGFSVGSQNEEDGILVEIFKRIGTTNKEFFEFGVGAGLQNCTVYFLLAGWRGGWVEINQAKYSFIEQKFKYYVASGKLSLSNKPINPENIDLIAKLLGIPEDVDLMSIDIDGNDYFVFQEMTIRPRVLVIEYNGLFPPPHKIVQAYDPDYVYSPETYLGASLQSLTDLALTKGYKLVGTNLSGLNAFYVRDDCYNSKLFSAPDPAQLYNLPRHQLAWGGAFNSGLNVAVSPLQEASREF